MKQKILPRIVKQSERTPETCAASMERRVHMILKDIEVLKNQGVEYRPNLYTREQVDKMFDAIKSGVLHANKVFESGLHRKPEKPFKF